MAVPSARAEACRGSARREMLLPVSYLPWMSAGPGLAVPAGGVPAPRPGTRRFAFGGACALRERGGAGPLPRLPWAAPPALTRALCGRWYRQSVWSRSKPTTSHSAREKCCCIAKPAPPPQAGGRGGGERGGRRKERGRRFLRSRARQSGAGPRDTLGPPRRDRPHLRHGPSASPAMEGRAQGGWPEACPSARIRKTRFPPRLCALGSRRGNRGFSLAWQTRGFGACLLGGPGEQGAGGEQEPAWVSDTTAGATPQRHYRGQLAYVSAKHYLLLHYAPSARLR